LLQVPDRGSSVALFPQAAIASRDTSEKPTAKPGDYVIILGVGSNTYWARKLPEQLAAG
jgi:hypothetical protein